MNFPLPIMPPIIPAAVTNATIFKTADPVVAASTAVFTFTNVAIGTAATGRRVVVGFGTVVAGAAVTATNLQIAGATAVLRVIATSSAGGVGPMASLWNLQVDSGTTATIVGTLSGAAAGAGLGVWAVYDSLSSTPTATAISTSNPFTAALNIDAGGVGVGYLTDNAGPVPTQTWTGLVEDFDETIGGSSAHSGASRASATALSPANVTVTPSVFTAGALVLASFR